jgi:hypothetical protein
MRWIKKYNEEVKFDWEWNPECVRLQNIINSYNNELINDEVWKNFYHRIPLYYEKQKDSEFLEEIIEFAKKRIEDIKSENIELLRDVKSIFQDFEDDVDFIEEIKYKLGDGDVFKLSVIITLDDNINDINYIGLLPFYTQFAIENIWTNISTISKRLKKLYFSCDVNYTVSKKINFMLKLN